MMAIRGRPGWFTEQRALAGLRILLFAGLGLHFGPSLLNHEDVYGSQAVELSKLTAAQLHGWLGLPFWIREGVGLLVLASLLAAAMGIALPATLTVGVCGTYFFNCVNSLHTSTLALGIAWTLGLIWLIVGGWPNAFVLRGYRRKTSDAGTIRTTCFLLAIHLWAPVFWSGLEKLRAGWISGETMVILVNSPPDYYLRAWLVDVGTSAAPSLGLALSWATVLVELGGVLLLLLRRTRWAASWVLLGFFVTIAIALEVPPLFVCLYLGACALTMALSPPASP